MRAMKKMALVSAASVFLLCCFAAASQDCERFAATGQNVSVPLGYNLKTTHALKWKFKDTTIFHKRAGKVITGKKDDVTTDGSLRLKNINKSQEGIYTPEVFNENGIGQLLKTTHLCVLDPVRKPTINSTCRNSEVIFTCGHNQQPDGAQYKWFQSEELMNNETQISVKRRIAEIKNINFSCNVSNEVSSEKSESWTNTCIEPVKTPELNATCSDSEVIFTCIAAQPDDAQYKWLLNGNVIANETNISLIRGISGSKKMNFSCQVYNEASSENSGSLTHSCEEPNFLGLPKELFGISIWVFIGSGGGFVLVLIIIIIVCCVRCKRKKKIKNNDEEELHLRRAQRSSPYCSH
ncbi:uncharacterized protein V3H82_023909 [Fundulus diaphanus]